ncbi:MAG: class I SAM-dependent methyltransferase [Pyrinomonadaceae bacterium]
MNPQDKQPSLAERLRERIAREGAITFHDWMAAALYDERCGYYCRADAAPWGRAGDYRTSPERSPLFAATCARYFATLHEELGSPARWTIFEAGAGAGDYARGVLETLARDHARVFHATHYVIDEVGEAARASIQAKLLPFAGRVEFHRLRDLDKPPGVGVVFSNELVDAFPVHRVLWNGGRLRELCVGLNASGGFAWVEREPSTPRLAAHFARLGVNLSEGQRAEVNLAADEWAAQSAALITRGFVITVDYGAMAETLYDAKIRPDGTLRAFRAHSLSDDLLASPGEQDLTATVNWTQLARAGVDAGLETVLLERQDKFLLRAGVLEALEGMTVRADGEAERARLSVAAREMILPGGMSESFQVLVQKK